jgi:hypothetical protein
MKIIKEKKIATVIDIKRNEYKDFISSSNVVYYDYIVTFDNGDIAHWGAIIPSSNVFIVGKLTSYILTTIRTTKGIVYVTNPVIPRDID